MADHRGGRLTAFLWLISANWITLLGANLATVSFAANVIMLVALLLGVIHHGYGGLLVFLVLPGIFVAGLLLIPVGLWYENRRGGTREREEHAQHPYPVIDFNRQRTWDVLKIVAALTGINVFMLTIVSYQGVRYSETNTFCGLACHTVMEPHHEAFLDSTHANTGCVKCHKGPGATGFVVAKMAGVRQLFQMAAGSYPRPVHTPRGEYLPARDACMGCHDPGSGKEEVLRVHSKFLDDEENTPVYSVLFMYLDMPGGDSGIHGWHSNPERTIEYIAEDDSLETIHVVRVTDPDGTVTEYGDADANPGDGRWRGMTCIDCHNRVGHDFRAPEGEVDRYLAKGAVDRAVPSVKSVILDAIYAGMNDGAPGRMVADAVLAHYREDYPEYVAEHGAAVEEAASAAEAIYSRNVFPEMNVDWTTYPRFNGHIESEGCFRCHDEGHATRDGRVIRQDCMMCHNVLAWDEDSPSILRDIGWFDLNR